MDRDESCGAPASLATDVDALSELSDADLDRVVGGLQRAWVVDAHERERVNGTAFASVPVIVHRTDAADAPTARVPA